MSAKSTFTLTVNGKAEIPLLAERAIINVAVSSEGLDKAKVSSEVISAAKHIESLLRELSPEDAGPLAHWSKTSLSATSYVPTMYSSSGEAEPKSRRYNGKITFDIRFSDFKALGSFGTKISSIEHVEVSDISWRLTEATEAKYRNQLRKDAAKDALAKARDYCEVLGCIKLRPVELHEHQTHSASANIRACRRIDGVDARPIEKFEELEFTQQEVRITRNVSIKFHADPVV